MAADDGGDFPDGPACRALHEEISSRSTLHAVTGHLVVRLANCNLGDTHLRGWASTQLLAQIEVFRDAGNVVRQADFDLSHNDLTDVGLSALLKAWAKTGAACPLLLKLHFNRLGDSALGVLAAFIRTYRGQVRELHLTNNTFSSHDAVMELLGSFTGLPQYPMWIRRQRRYAPVYLRLGHCGLANVGTLMERVTREGSVRLCLMEDGHCSKTLCSQAERGNSSSCPVAHLYGFLQQDRGGEPLLETASGTAEASEAPSPAAGDSNSKGADLCPTRNSFIEPPVAAAAAPTPVAAALVPAGTSPSASSSAPAVTPDAVAQASRQREKGSTYDCGLCGRLLPLDMFGRHQFRKAAAVDSATPEAKDQPGDAPVTPAHVVRRCNDCVKQPCSACGEELALSAFGKGQMMRPRGQRRCRACTAETMLCMRCGQPKPRSGFSQVEVQKRKLLPRVCSDCEQTNPYFERRYGLVLVFSEPKHMAGSRGCLPCRRLPLDVVRRIASFSEPGDEFTQISRTEFECGLCGRSWSFATNDVDRHVRCSQVHRQRLEKLEKGLLLRIGALGLEASRFQNGLGIRGAVCSRERAEEARALVHVQEALSQGVAMEALRSAGLAPERSWVAPRVLEVAMQLQLGAATPPPEASSAEIKSAQRRWMLFGHMGAEAEGHADAAEELSALSAMLSYE